MKNVWVIAKSSTSSCLDVFQKLMDFHNQGTRLIKLCYIMYYVQIVILFISAHLSSYSRLPITVKCIANG